MNDPSGMITKWLERVESKIDRIGERTVTRDEFERYKIDAQKKITAIELQIEKIRDQAAEREIETQNRKADDAMKLRLFWSGLILTPIVTFGINFFLLRGGV